MTEAMAELLRDHVRKGIAARERDAQITAGLSEMAERLIYANAAPMRDQEKAQEVSERILNQLFATQPTN